MRMRRSSWSTHQKSGTRTDCIPALAHLRCDADAMLLTPSELARLRVVLREKEAQLDATPRGTTGRNDLMRSVHELRGIWRQAEAAIGNRHPSMAVGNSTVDPVDLAKLSTLTRGLKKAGQRNTGRPISGDIHDFEQRVQARFGLDPGVKVS